MVKIGTLARAKKIRELSVSQPKNDYELERRGDFGEFKMLGYGYSRRAFLHKKSGVVYKVGKYSLGRSRWFDSINVEEHRNFEVIRSLGLSNITAPVSQVFSFPALTSPKAKVLSERHVIACEYVESEAVKCECWGDYKCSFGETCWYHWSKIAKNLPQMHYLELQCPIGDLHSGNVGLMNKMWYILDAGD